MLDKIPSTEELAALVGSSLYDVWQKICIMIDEKYDWTVFGIKAAKHGRMNISIAEVVKHFVRYMRDKTALGL